MYWLMEAFWMINTHAWGQDKTDSLHFCTDCDQGAKENLWAQETTGYVMYLQRNTVARSRYHCCSGNFNNAFCFLSPILINGMILWGGNYWRWNVCFGSPYNCCLKHSSFSEYFHQIAPCMYFNFRFSPCICKVNHFYWPTNALNCIKLKG